jgi:sec-independent protein translocase protein TatC
MIHNPNFKVVEFDHFRMQAGLPSFVMGVVFQLPVIAFFLGKLGIITSDMLANYRKHSFIVIMLIAAIITPPDLMTLILVTIPLYLLYEVSIRVVKWVE